MKGVLLVSAATCVSLFYLIKIHNRFKRKGSSSEFTNTGTKIISPQRRSCESATTPENGRIIELTSIESGMTRMSEERRGLMKVCLKLDLRPTAPLSSSELESQISSSVQVLAQRHPFLRCKLEKRKDNEMILKECQDTVPTVEYKYLEREPRWISQWRQYERRPVKAGETLFNFIVILPPPSSTNTFSKLTILLIGHHAFCDGKSLASLGHEFLLTLGKENKNLESLPLKYGKPMSILCSEFIGESFFQNCSHCYRLFLTLLRMIKRGTGQIFPVADPKITPLDLPMTCYTNANYIDLDQEETQKLLDLCQQHSTTVTGALGVCVTDSFGDVSQCEPGANIVLGCAVNLRPLYHPPVPDEELSYQISASNLFSTSHKYHRTKEELWQLSQSFRKSIEISLQEKEPLTMATFISEMGFNKPTTYNTPTSVTISNWGILPFVSSYGHWDLLDVRPVVNLNHLRFPSCLVTTTNNRLTICVLGVTPCLDKEDLQKFADTIRLKIHQMMNTKIA